MIRQLLRDFKLRGVVKISVTLNKKSSNLATYYGGALFSKIVFFFHVYTLILARLLFKRLSLENKMWYFLVKHSTQFFVPGKYGLALPRILDSGVTSMF